MHPPRTGYAYLDEPREAGRLVAMAHRGGARHPALRGLENTRRAFGHAVALGYRYLETDVRATRDGVLLAFHDADLGRVTDRPGPLRAARHADLRTCRVGGTEPIPTLAELLEEFPDARFNVDLKAPDAVAPMVRLVERTGVHDRVCVSSFTERVLRRFRRLAGPRVLTACGVTSVAVLRYAGPRAEGVLRDRGSAYQVPITTRGLRITDAAFVARAHATGRHVHVWTVDDRAEMERMIDLGVDGLITDRTDVLREVLARRGMW